MSNEPSDHRTFYSLWWDSNGSLESHRMCNCPRDTRLAIPLIALQYGEVMIDVTFSDPIVVPESYPKHLLLEDKK